MQNFQRDSQWLLRDGQALRNYHSIVYSQIKNLLPKGLKIGDEGIETNNPIDRDYLKIKIVICDTAVSLPHCVLILQKHFSKQDKDLIIDLYSQLDSIIPDYCVRLTTNDDGKCLFCGKEIKDLVYSEKFNDLEPTFSCCGFNYDLEESLSMMTGARISIEKNKIFVHYKEEAYKRIVEIFPNIYGQIFFVSLQ